MSAVTTDELADMAEKAEELLRDALKIPGTDAVRAALNDAGMRRARQRVTECVDVLDASQRDYRKAQDAERDAKDAFDSAVTEAEWELDGRFVVEGNKTFLVTGEDELVPTPSADEPDAAVPSGRKVRKAMTADERAKWKAHEAHKLPAVAKAAEALRKAESHTAERRDGITIADKSLSAARADLDAAIATLQAWVAVLPRRVA